MKSGFVSLIGRPNAGKSTLMNSIVGAHVAITTDKPQTTRNLIEGIYTTNDTQIVFMDTPGIHKPNHKLGKYLNREAYYSIDDVDVILYMVDANEELGGGDKYVIDKLKEVEKPVILVLNKIDKIKKDVIFNRINQFKDLYNFSDIVPVSALRKDNIDTLLDVIKKYLPDGVKYFADDEITNKSTQFMITELVREKVMNLTNDEIPHSITCVLDNLENNKTSYKVQVSIIVDRDSLKRIIIGKQGSMIKEIGVQARPEIEELLGKKVFLELYVRTIAKWRDREKYLHEFGFNDLDE